jgi:hypothetical protein
MTACSKLRFGQPRLINQAPPRSVAFYSVLFGQPPTKTRPGYAKFEVAEPPVNLALNAMGGPTGPNNAVAHFGIQLKSTAAVRVASHRFAQAGLAIVPEEVTAWVVQITRNVIAYHYRKRSPEVDLPAEVAEDCEFIARVDCKIRM